MKTKLLPRLAQMSATDFPALSRHGMGGVSRRAFIPPTRNDLFYSLGQRTFAGGSLSNEQMDRVVYGT